MTPPTDAFDAALTLAHALEAAGVPYCIGGAIAYGQYGIPRATKDVDLNVFLAPAALRPALDALGELGVAWPADPVADAVAEGLIVGHWFGYRIDLFTPSIPFAWEAERTKRRFDFAGRGAWFLSAEALAVFKLLFFRGKDLVDLERLLAVMGDTLDRGYVRRQIVAMMGDDDERIVAWDRMVGG